MFVLFQDYEVRDFNFSVIWDPDLKPGRGPREHSLYKLVYESRTGLRDAAFEFADTVDWTLRPATFEAFQRAHGPRPVEYRDWFYSKLHQFIHILVYEELRMYGLGPGGGPGKPQTEDPWKEGGGPMYGEGPIIQAHEIEEALQPEDLENATVNWFRVAWGLARAGERRLEMLRKWFRQLKERRSSVHARGRSWTKNAERDQIIRNCLNRGMERRQICQELGRRTIATLPSMQRYEIHKWMEAWDDPEFRNAIQQLFAKVSARQKSVKPPPVAG